MSLDFVFGRSIQNLGVDHLMDLLPRIFLVFR